MRNSSCVAIRVCNKTGKIAETKKYANGTSYQLQTRWHINAATITTNTKSVTFASDTEPSAAIIDDLKYLCMAGWP